MLANSQSGSVEPFELLRLLGRLDSGRGTGLVRLAQDDAEVRLYLVDGQPRLCIGAGRRHSFPAHCVRTQLLTATSLQTYMQRAHAESIRLEEFLVRSGKLSGAQLRSIQGAMSAYAFADVFCSGASDHRYEPGAPPAVVEKFHLEPDKAICEYLARFDETDHVRVVAANRSARLARGPRWAQVEPAAEGVFGDVFRGIASRLDAGTTPSAEARNADLKRVATVIYALWRLDAIRLATGSTRAEQGTFEAPLGRLPGRRIPRAELTGLRALLRAQGFEVHEAAPEPANETVERVIETGAETVGETEPASTASAPNDAAEPAEPVPVASNVPGGVGLSAELARAVAAAASEEDAARKAKRPASRVVADSGSGLTTPPASARAAPSDSLPRILYDLRVRLSRVDAFDALGVAPGATPSEIKDAYVALRARYDRQSFGAGTLTGEGLDDLAAVETGFDTAVDRLLDPEQRRLLESRAEGGLTDVEVTAYFDAERSYKDGRRLREKDSLARARKRFLRAVELNSREPEYYYWAAQTIWDERIGEGTWNEQGRQEVERMIRDALVLRPDYEAARLLLARLYLEKGDGRAALKLYQQVVDDNPNNVEAAAAVKELAGFDEGGDGITGRLGNIIGRLRRDK